MNGRLLRAFLGWGALALFAVSCKQSIFNSPSGDSIAGKITIKKFMGLEPDAWRIEPRLNKVSTNQSVFNFEGTCSRGVLAVKILLNGAEVASGIDCSTESFSWSQELATDGVYSLEFQPLFKKGATGTNSSPAILDVVLDRVAPDSPIVTTNSGNSYASTSPNFVLEGTTSEDTFALHADEHGKLDFSAFGRIFDFKISLAQGETRTLSFRAEDFAGNLSVPTTISISFSSTIVLTHFQTSALGVNVPTVGTAHRTQLGQATMTHLIPPNNHQDSESGALKLRSGIVELGTALKK